MSYFPCGNFLAKHLSTPYTFFFGYFISYSLVLVRNILVNHPYTATVFLLGYIFSSYMIVLLNAMNKIKWAVSYGVAVFSKFVSATLALAKALRSKTVAAMSVIATTLQPVAVCIGVNMLILT